MKRLTCFRCKTYVGSPLYGTLPIEMVKEDGMIVMIPIYVNVIIEGKRKWVRVGYYCPRCHSFEDGSFKPHRRAL